MGLLGFFVNNEEGIRQCMDKDPPRFFSFQTYHDM